MCNFEEDTYYKIMDINSGGMLFLPALACIHEPSQSSSLCRTSGSHFSKPYINWYIFSFNTLVIYIFKENQ